MIRCVYMYSKLHYVHASGYKGTFIPYMHVDFRLFLNILVFKQVVINKIVDSSKMLWKKDNGDDLMYLKVNLNMWLKKKG